MSIIPAQASLSSCPAKPHKRTTARCSKSSFMRRQECRSALFLRKSSYALAALYFSTAKRHCAPSLARSAASSATGEPRQRTRYSAAAKPTKNAIAPSVCDRVSFSSAKWADDASKEISMSKGSCTRNTLTTRRLQGSGARWKEGSAWASCSRAWSTASRGAFWPPPWRFRKAALPPRALNTQQRMSASRRSWLLRGSSSCSRAASKSAEQRKLSCGSASSSSASLSPRPRNPK
mmetsp:Transcript_34819/g.108322  ORF Transcript_34819/g.108322 Transcript_34819/m.108322 type:complete len:234 (-) Transcript_34819:437-1138(-)